MEFECDRLQVGDIVHLKCGSPPMIIDRVTDDKNDGRTCTTVWVDCEGRPWERDFSEQVLEKITEEEMEEFYRENMDTDTDSNGDN